MNSHSAPEKSSNPFRTALDSQERADESRSGSFSSPSHVDGLGDRPWNQAATNDSDLPPYSGPPVALPEKRDFYPSASTQLTSTSGSSSSQISSTPFWRQPPRDLPYPSFQPMFLITHEKYLDKGFPRAPPPSKDASHPFPSHDVGEGDWLSFLDEIQRAATLTKKQIARSYLPIVSIIPIVGALSSYGVRTYMKGNKIENVVKVVDTWNHHFFGPRRMQISLMKGHTKLSGQHNIAVPNLYTPEATLSTSSKSIEVQSSLQKGKTVDKGDGRAIDNDDTSYRLFVVPL